VDTRDLGRVLSFDSQAGTVEVESGIQWRPLVEELLARQEGAPRQWGIAQKQTGADRLSIGGALSANVHGRGLRMKPFVGDIESFVLIDADANPLRCSRRENAELFRLAVGGYGLFGLVYSVKLRLAQRRKVRRIVREASAEDLAGLFRDRIEHGFLYGDFQFAVDAESDCFLRRGVFSCYEPVDDGKPPAEGGAELSKQDWSDLIRLAHVDKGRAYRRYADYYLSTSGQEYWSDLHQLTTYVDDYHAAMNAELGHEGSEMITELYVPRESLADFLASAAHELRRRRAEVIYGTVRLIERDDETFLPWARESYACVVLNLHVEHTTRGVEEAAGQFRSLIDLAAARGGSFYLTYHRFATRSQVEAAYPQFGEFLARPARAVPERLVPPPPPCVCRRRRGSASRRPLEASNSHLTAA
jgi:FAD/FMN-containing dehydrogenase